MASERGFRVALAGLVACGLIAGGCGAGARRAPAPSSVTTGGLSPSSSAGGGPGATSAGASAAGGAQYAQYYRANGTATAVAGATLPVQAADFAFSPNTLLVKTGTRVRLKVDNTSPEAHNFDLPAFGVNVSLPAGQTTAVTFTAGRTGTYYFYCNLPGHAQAGMVGRITVS